MRDDLNAAGDCLTVVAQESIPEGEFRQLIQLAITHCLANRSDELSLENLPIVVAGSQSEKALPVAAAWQMIHAAAKLIDDIEDGDLTDAVSTNVNLATGLIFSAHVALSRLSDFGVTWEQIYRVSSGLDRACLFACAGQQDDILSRMDQKSLDPDRWFEIARRKSGELFAWACWAGALVTDMDEGALRSLREYGLRLGILVQLADDFNGIWGGSEACDLLGGQLSLPVIYADYVAGQEEKDDLDVLIAVAARGDREAARQAINRITALGAQKYVLAAACIQRAKAIEALQRISPPFPQRQNLSILLDKVFPTIASIDHPSHGTTSECIPARE